MAQGSSNCGEKTTEGCDSQGTSSTARANSDLPPSYEDSVAYNLCPEGYFDKERNAGHESHTPTTSHRPRTPPPAASSQQLNIINSPWPWTPLPASSSRPSNTATSTWLGTPPASSFHQSNIITSNQNNPFAADPSANPTSKQEDPFTADFPEVYTSTQSQVFTSKASGPSTSRHSAPFTIEVSDPLAPEPSDSFTFRGSHNIRRVTSGYGASNVAATHRLSDPRLTPVRLSETARLSDPVHLSDTARLTDSLRLPESQPLVSSSRQLKTSSSSKHLRASGDGESKIAATLRLQDTQPPTSTSTTTLCYGESGTAATLRLTIPLRLPDIQLLASSSTNTSRCGESTIAATLRLSDTRPPTSSSTNTSSSSKHLTTSPYGESGIAATLRFPDTQLPEASSRHSTISSGDFTSGQSHSIRRTTSNYQPSSVIFDTSAKSSSNSSHHQMASSNNVPSRMMAPVGSSPSVSAMGPTADDNAMAKNLIRQNPEIMNNIYTLVEFTVNAMDNGRQGPNKHNAEIESLQKELFDSNNNAKEQAAKVEKLEADLKAATDNGLANEKTIEDLQKQLKDAQDIEKNLRRGQVANTNELIPLRAQHKSLQRKFKDLQQEATSLQDRVDYQNGTLEVLSRKAREYELKAARMQDDLMALERENRELMEKGEHISGKIFAVAEQWNESGASMGGHMAGGMGGVMVGGMQGGRGGAMRGDIGGDMGRGGSMGGHMARDEGMSRGAGMARGGDFGGDFDGRMGGDMGGGMGDDMDEYREGGIDGRRKRQAEKFLEDEECKRRFSRMTR